MKFDQFRHADFGWPPRMFVAEIGFLGTWWVGLIGTWFLARVALRRSADPASAVTKALVVIAGVAAVSGALGFVAGPWWFGSRAGWKEALESLDVGDPESFHRVAGIHLGSYAGAFAGWLAMMAAGIRSRPGARPER